MRQTTLWLSSMWILRLRVPEDVQQIQQQLAAAQESTRMVAKEEGRARLQTNGRDICKFLTESAHEGRTFFNKENELAKDPKFERVRNWSTMLEIKDYLLPALADM